MKIVSKFSGFDIASDADLDQTVCGVLYAMAAAHGLDFADLSGCRLGIAKSESFLALPANTGGPIKRRPPNRPYSDQDNGLTPDFPNSPEASTCPCSRAAFNAVASAVRKADISRILLSDATC